jgi:hypothetical protein
MPTEQESYQKSFASDGSGCDLCFCLTWKEPYATGNGVRATG